MKIVQRLHNCLKQELIVEKGYEVPSLIREESTLAGRDILVWVKNGTGKTEHTWRQGRARNEASFPSHYISGKILVERG